MGNSIFVNRNGLNQRSFIDNDFPTKARTALDYLLVDLNEKNYLVDSSTVIRELNRMGRLTKQDIEPLANNTFIDQISQRIHKLAWFQVFSFCERVYSKLLCEVNSPFNDYFVSLNDVRSYYSDELNLIMEEENLSFIFVEGLFNRRGKAQTQKSLERVGTVLSDPKLDVVKTHFNKARKFFNNRPEPDLENCVKESLISLEACVEILTSKDASKDFEKVIKKLQGNGPNQIPNPIGEGIIKIHGYRGSGQGVSHASLSGYRVTSSDAELVLSIVASYISYLVDIFPQEEDIPF